MLYPFLLNKNLIKEGVSISGLLALASIPAMLILWLNWAVNPPGKNPKYEVPTVDVTPMLLNGIVFSEYSPTPISTLWSGESIHVELFRITSTPSPTGTIDYAATELYTLTALYLQLSASPTPTITVTARPNVWIATPKPVQIVEVTAIQYVDVTVPIPVNVPVIQTRIVVVTPSFTPSPSPTPTIEVTEEITDEPTFTPTVTETPTYTSTPSPTITSSPTLDIIPSLDPEVTEVVSSSS